MNSRLIFAARTVIAVLIAVLVTRASAGPLEPRSSAVNQGEGLRFARIFTTNMVLQQKKPANVWGWAKPGSKVSVTMQADDTLPPNTEASAKLVYQDQVPIVITPKTLKATADKNGKWQVQFAAMLATFKPRRITVKDSTGKTVTIKNILIGEVWVHSGQSNMVWGGASNQDLWDEGLQFHGMRYVKYDASWPRPLDDLPKKIEWSVTGKGTHWSKVSFVFARALHLKLGVPIGIINNARGGTRGISWASREEMKSIKRPALEKELTEYDAQVKEWDSPESVARLIQAQKDVVAVWRPRARKEIAAHWEQFDRFMKEKLDAAKYAEWRKVADNWSKAIERKHNSPGAIPSWKVWGLERTAQREFFKGTDIKVPAMDRKLWKERPNDKDPRAGWSPPAGLFNAVAAPLRGLAIAGILYYQGENENFVPLDMMETYEDIFPKVISTHRRNFNDPKLPFGIISLAGWGKYADSAEAGAFSKWAWIMDVHRKTHDTMSNTGLISIYDLGHSSIHPPDKQGVGQRAARWALGAVYGKKVQYKPTFSYKSAEMRDGKMLVRFVDGAGKAGIPSTFEGNEVYRGFTISGSDRRWYKATVKVNKREKALEVSSGLVTKPVAVRYAWARFSDGNLGTRAIAMPMFRSDDWGYPKVDRSIEDRKLKNNIKKLIAEREQERELKACLKHLEQLTEGADPKVKAQVEALQKQLEKAQTE